LNCMTEVSPEFILNLGRGSERLEADRVVLGSKKWDATSFGTRKTRGSEAVTWEDDVAEIRSFLFFLFFLFLKFCLNSKFLSFVEVRGFQIPLGRGSDVGESGISGHRALGVTGVGGCLVA
jgi:hypothetical protein